MSGITDVTRIKNEEVNFNIRDDLDEASYKKLCGKEKLCEDIESEVVCDGEWCVIHRSCRLK